ncbi:tRNA pseudouridine(38-40) synthase TruA [Candidatus Profftia sp. (ex Adelges kitamiensis)]|uniref:tRNA pseudouridine(38-40) synthase TruA n=1 Tax=Candidatus Profftia sp. (ex Adelges kitamiensis) TaxID=2864218 RepID=UPI001CE23E61|nr:tRNA pseudouridine(38-40) synthase TruA [Candidatus Profftia sp. (ex Adelges kitamiensis)]
MLKTTDIYPEVTPTNYLLYKIALGIEYDGSQYSGWQRQLDVSSVQEYLERALSKVAGEPITIFCAGRTDAGVHATGQVIHLETNVKRKDSSWIMGVNSHIPKDIAVRWIKVVNKNFHARFSAIARRYRYIIYNNRYRKAILQNGMTYFPYYLDAASMERAGQVLLGENDFTSFRSSHCQSCTPWRKVFHLKVIRLGEYVIIDIKANSFLHHMVRNIVGSLIEIGRGHYSERWIAELLKAKDRRLAAATAKSSGLYLISVDYPGHFELPKTKIGPLF